MCVPFLLFCIGLDPKSDLSLLSRSIDDSTHCHTPLQLYTLLIESKQVTQYPFIPSSKLLNTGCKALLMFLCIKDYEIETGFVIKTGENHNNYTFL